MMVHTSLSMYWYVLSMYRYSSYIWKVALYNIIYDIISL
jgi:hypothetical protein